MQQMNGQPVSVNQQEGEKKLSINLITNLNLEESFRGLPSVIILEGDIEEIAHKTKVGEGFMVPEDFDIVKLKELVDSANNLVRDGITTQTGQDKYINNTVVEVAKIVLARMYLKRQAEKDTEIYQ